MVEESSSPDVSQGERNSKVTGGKVYPSKVHLQ
jgi:hypothetical protein